jgi:hypothetical protein
MTGGLLCAYCEHPDRLGGYYLSEDLLHKRNLYREPTDYCPKYEEHWFHYLHNLSEMVAALKRKKRAKYSGDLHVKISLEQGTVAGVEVEEEPP